MHKHVIAPYHMLSITESLRQLSTINQYENKNLLDYIKWFKQTHDVLKSQLGTEFMDTFNQERYRTCTKQDGRIKMNKDTFKIWMAFLLMKVTVQYKYGTLLEGFLVHLSLVNYQYPKTITTATDVLSNHELHPKLYEKKVFLWKCVQRHWIQKNNHN